MPASRRDRSDRARGFARIPLLRLRAPVNVTARTTDARLARALTLLDNPDVRVLSLDVFDTMLWRQAPEPIDVFPLIAPHLHARGLLVEQITPRVFQKM